MNMDYCKFENTVRALYQVMPHLRDVLAGKDDASPLSNDELYYAAELVDLCQNILADVREKLDLDSWEPLPQGWSQLLHDNNEMLRADYEPPRYP